MCVIVFIYFIRKFIIIFFLFILIISLFNCCGDTRMAEDDVPHMGTDDRLLF
jgi:hypothetical protein